MEQTTCELCGDPTGEEHPTALCETCREDAEAAARAEWEAALEEARIERQMEAERARAGRDEAAAVDA